MAAFGRLFFIFFMLLISVSHAQSSFRPKALVLPVRKDAPTLQYVTKINQGTPPDSTVIHLVAHLGGKIPVFDYDSRKDPNGYVYITCPSSQCQLASPIACGLCSNLSRRRRNPDNSCDVIADNPFIGTATVGELAEDVVSVQSTDGSNPGPLATVPGFISVCAETSLFQGLAGGVTGLLGLGRGPFGLPSQFAYAFSFQRKFAICLPSSTSADGVIFFGDGPYKLLPNIDPSQSLRYTPLFINPVSTDSALSRGDLSDEYLIRINSIRVNEKPLAINNTLLKIDSQVNVGRKITPSDEYFIRINSIIINEKPLAINNTLLKIDSQGNGGTKISTVNAYTTLESSIYRAFTSLYIQEAAARNISRVASVAPFNVCFSSQNVNSTRVGPSVPYIDLVLQGENAVWTITGSNSMVQVNDNVLCLGFLDGGLNPRTSIVIGGYQIEDNFLQFDLAASRLGFSSTLLGRQTTCANFNFTSNA